MTTKVVPVILAGGQGTRLWPLSRSSRPKQFLPLLGTTSLFQNTLDRVRDKSRYAPAIIITNSEYRFLVAEQAAEGDHQIASIILEPEARNTAVAIAVAAAHALKVFGPHAMLHVLPSDHDVDTSGSYWGSIEQAIEAAQLGALVTFGVKPRSPETGFGYIKSTAQVGQGAQTIEQFVEKPNVLRAQEMLTEGGYFWNSGMFVGSAEHFLAECALLSPETHKAAIASLDHAKVDLDFLRLDARTFETAPNISIDYAIFEKTKKAVVVAVDFPWSDLGSWNAVWKNAPQDSSGNVVRGQVSLSGVTNSLVVTEQVHVVVDDLDDVAVISTNDAVYVGRLSSAQNVGAVVKLLRAKSETSSLTEIHRITYRPWGGYASVLEGDRFQVKKLFVKPGKKLSLQKHHHRAEHWVVVRGTAEVTVDGIVTALSENESIYLPRGCIHRLHNPGKIELEVIEVQTGAYLGEDDIIRIEDEFGRP